MRFRFLIPGGILLLAGIAVLTPALDAAPVPDIYAVAEGRQGDSGDRVLLLAGNKLQKVRSYMLLTDEGMPIGALNRLNGKKSRNLDVLEIPRALVRPDYTIPGPFQVEMELKKGNQTFGVWLTLGYSDAGRVDEDALDAVLADDLADATTFDGRPPSFYRDASNLVDGTLDPARYRAILNLQLFGDLGPGAGQVATGDHGHDGTYVNLAGDDMTGPLSVISDDGSAALVADNAGSSGLVLLLRAGGGDVAWIDRTGKGSFSGGIDGFLPATAYSNPGTINAAANPVDFSKLKNVPAGFADGVDDGESYTPGAGISIASNQISVKFGGTGSGNIAARFDHDHDGEYVSATSPALASELSATIAGQTTSSAAITGTTTKDGIGVKGVATSTATNFATYGLYGDAASPNGRGAYAAASNDASGATNYGVYAIASGGKGTGVYAETESTGAGPTYGVRSICRGSDGYGVYSEVTDTGAGTTYGVYALSKSENGYGVYARGATGVYAAARENDRYGVYGDGQTNAAAFGVYGVTDGGSSLAGVRGHHTGAGTGQGVHGTTTSSQGTGVRGEGGLYGVHGSNALSGGAGVFAESTHGSKGTALLARLSGASSTGDIAVFQLGTTNKARIDSTGKGYFDGGTATSGADFAESVAADRSRGPLEPGDVLVIDVKAPRRFTLSTEPESALVAGVYSTRPGVLARPADVTSPGDWAEDEVPLAVVGIVPTKVCDEGGPIEIGDLLVTASLPGHAMKAPERPRPGTLLGKALGSLPQGRGSIEVLLGPGR